MYLGRIVEIMNGAAFRMHARHPYTKALLGSVFSIYDDPDKDIYVLEGEAQSPTGEIKGCVFCNRCSQAKDICRQEAPVLKPIRPATLPKRRINWRRSDSRKVDADFTQKFIRLK